MFAGNAMFASAESDGKVSPQRKDDLGAWLRTVHYPVAADSLEMAVRMLRAQNEPGAPASAEHGSDAPGAAGGPNADCNAGSSCGMARPVSPASLLAQPALQASYITSYCCMC